MGERTIQSLDSLLGDIEIDKVGVVTLGDWQDTSWGMKARQLLPGANSIIVLTMEVLPEVVRHLSSKAQVGELALRDLYDRNIEVITGILDWQAYKIVKKLHIFGLKGLILPAGGAPSDERFLEGTISYKHLAEAAGIGILGWNSLLISAEYGSRIRIACIITDAVLESSVAAEIQIPCVKCGGACVKICPVKAIKIPPDGEQYVIDKYACSTYYTASGSCAECLKVCPTV
ncbi:4Fe-4S dicluster domain-containing protein [Chloroflexota bacterium]